MPEGHSVHRIARQFTHNFVGHAISASSPQGRFVDGAFRLDGRVLETAFAVGKQMFIGFGDDIWLRVHLGLYGAWDFAGEITTDPTIESADGRMGQTNGRGTQTALDVLDRAGEDSVSSIGAPRRARVRMSEQTRGDTDVSWETFPPAPVGAVRLRLATDRTVADLRGPTACVIQNRAEMEASVAKLGPDPAHDGSPAEAERFVRAVRKRSTAIGKLLMDQAVVSGIGNVYRAEILYRAGLDPHTPGKLVPEELVRRIWEDWVLLLRSGIETGQMMTIDGLTGDEFSRAMANRDDRHWVYKREGLPCRTCGTHILLEDMAGRKLYWCPGCQH